MGQFAIGKVAAPATVERNEKPHACGRCRTPFGVTNPDCPNRPKGERRG